MQTGSSSLLVFLVTCLIFGLLVVVIFFAIKLRRAHITWKRGKQWQHQAEAAVCLNFSQMYFKKHISQSLMLQRMKTRIHLRRAVNPNQARKRETPKDKGEKVCKWFSTPFKAYDQKEYGNVLKKQLCQQRLESNNKITLLPTHVLRMKTLVIYSKYCATGWDLMWLLLNATFSFRNEEWRSLRLRVLAHCWQPQGTSFPLVNQGTKITCGQILYEEAELWIVVQ